MRAQGTQIPAPLRAPAGYFARYVAAERKGYSGVGLLSRRAPEAWWSTFSPEHDPEGRVLAAEVGDLLLVSAYFPNGNGSTLPNGKRSNDRVPFKLRFYKALWARLRAEQEAGRPILVMGDFNTAHEAIDLARPKANEKTSGFLPEERAELGRWLRSGWIDTFRHVHGPVEGAYSWWSQRGTCRARNIGWRLDYVLASPGALPFLREAFILPEVQGSDHCPVGVRLDPKVIGSP